MIRVFLVFLVGLVVMACGSASEPAGASTGTSSAALCETACSKIIACVSSLDGRTYDAASCEEACGKELRGEGYLDADVARVAFEAKRSLRPGPSCEADLPFFVEIERANYRTLERVDVIDRCEVAIREGGCGSAASAVFRSQCFKLFVKYAPRYRAGYEACRLPTGGCDDFNDCVDRVQLPPEVVRGQPWLGPEFVESP